MTVNAFLNPLNDPWGSEQLLVEDCIIESIQIIGVDMQYILREKLGRDYLFGEAPSSKFEEAITIEMEIMKISKFNGDGDIYSKLGIVHTDQAEFRVSTRRFKTEFENTTLSMPREGDLIFLPTNNSLWEIRYVNFDEDFQRFGKNYTYILKCDLFQFSHEEINTGDPEIDAFAEFDRITQDAADGLLKTLTLAPDNFIEESEMIGEEALGIESFNPDDPFREDNY